MYRDKESLLPPKKSSSLLNFSISFEQFLYMMVIMLPIITPGMAVGFSAIALPELTNLNLHESTLFASLPNVGAILGNIAIGFILDRYGRKAAFLSNTIPAFIGSILLAGPQTVLYLYAGQIFLGFAQCAATISPGIYIAESMAPNNLQFRSSLTAWSVMAINIGICLVFLLGYFFHYTYVAMIGAALSFISTILILIFLPESPAWLEQKGRHKEAKSAKYRLGFKDLQIEGSSIGYQPIEGEYQRENLTSYLSKIKRKDVYKPALTAIGYFFFQQFSGVQVLTAYMVNVLTVKTLSINPYSLTVIAGFLVVIGQIIYSLILPILGLRKMAMISSCGSSLLTIVLGLCIWGSDTTEWYVQILDYMHILTVWCMIIVQGLGFATIPYAILGEIFPMDAKGFASIPVFSVSVFYFSVLMIYPYALVLSPYAVYFAFAAVGFLSIIFIYFCIPETVGRTMNEISRGFS